MKQKKSQTLHPARPTLQEALNLRPGQSVELLKELHILTRDGSINQDSRRKLKQIEHLSQFIEPLLQEVLQEQSEIQLVDFGAGKSYLGFILHDLFFSKLEKAFRIFGIETREELVERSRTLADRLGFNNMTFLHLAAADAVDLACLPARIDVVTALHACDTATDDAIRCALAKHAKHIVLVPCCQAEVSARLRQKKAESLSNGPIAELWRRPLHTREFGSLVTNVLRALQLEAHGYQTTVTELVGWEHSMKNELIVASWKNLPGRRPAERLTSLLQAIGLEEMQDRFFTP